MIEENRQKELDEDHEHKDYSNKYDIFMALLPAILLVFITMELISVETNFQTKSCWKKVKRTFYY